MGWFGKLLGGVGGTLLGGPIGGIVGSAIGSAIGGSGGGGGGNINYGNIVGQFGQDLPGEGAYYAAIQQRRSGQIASLAQRQRQRGLEDLQARGLGGSGVAGSFLSDVAAQRALETQNVAQDVEGLRFMTRQQRINDALQYERQKVLSKMAKQDPNLWTKLAGAAGSALGTYLGGTGSPAAAATDPNDWYNTIMPSSGNDSGYAWDSLVGGQ